MNHTVRHEDGGTVEIKGMTRGKAIKLMCTECMGFNGEEVRQCNSRMCPLYPYKGASLAAKGQRT